jgi:hypothetical protein
MRMDTVSATIVAGGQAGFHLLNRFDSFLGKIMRKATHPSGGLGSSNPRRLRGWRLHHHGDGVC